MPRRLTIALATPKSVTERSGNRTTALRWAAILRSLGHRVSITAPSEAPDADLLVALHAKRSEGAIRHFHGCFPTRPILIVLTGTDLYGDAEDRLDPAVLSLAARLLVLQPLAKESLPPHWHNRTRVILQSSPSLPRQVRSDGPFVVLVVGHLRTIKDPLRTARAARLLPASSKICVRHLGRALEEGQGTLAEQEMRENPRYVWLKERSRAEVREELSRAHLLVQSSFAEGGANTVSEAIAAGVPVLASRVDGNEGLLGPSYPGYFPAGSTESLRDLLYRAESDPRFLANLEAAAAELAPMFAPAEERRRFECVLRELYPEPADEAGATAAHRLVIRVPTQSTRPSTLADDVHAGLHAVPKTLPCRWFYDEAGSRLFERLCETPEYEVTRAEIDLLR